MPHIHTNPGEYDHTVSAYIVRTDLAEPKVFLHKHKLLGVWMQPGGHIETNETPWRALAHEVLEETGYTFEQLDVLQPAERLKPLEHATVHPQPFTYLSHPFAEIDHHHTDVGFAFTTDQAPIHAIAEDESQEFDFLSKADLVELDMYENVRAICTLLFDSILFKWEPVPATDFET